MSTAITESPSTCSIPIASVDPVYRMTIKSGEAATHLAFGEAAPVLLNVLPVQVRGNPNATLVLPEQSSLSVIVNSALLKRVKLGEATTMKEQHHV